MITVLFFAALRERLQTPMQQLDSSRLPADPTAASVLSALQQESDSWRQELSRQDLLCAVNQQLCPLHTRVQPGDELAFFPPVTGG
ncbi:MoaD/ThiS family protein [Alkalimonas amylolytica]|uniref:Molybdopterin synthase sulfur carrier subunit n=1 Tax=Alkalimonas amylolytica TaxID=152573 RepID=A0A1H3ZN89_ALKAM|nr:MoaD/ThiS family protein [Alkalimonas amylolytica]SEA25256.1 molybdopterin synthase sulfur carrier subunit [Alkalimonas amylolytica]